MGLSERGPECVCVLLLLLLLVGNGGVGGQRKEDANEPVLINVCLISYSALSGHGKARGGEWRERWETIGRSSWESAGPTSDSLPLLRTLVLRNPSVNADLLSFRERSGHCVIGFLNEQLCDIQFKRWGCCDMWLLNAHVWNIEGLPVCSASSWS